MDILTTPKQNIIFDATIFTSLQACARKTDFQFNHNLQPMNGKSNSLEVGSVIHKVLEVYYKNIINGFDKSSCKQMGMAAGEMYIRGCKFCSDFESVVCNLCDGTGQYETESVADNTIIDIRTCQRCGGTKKTRPECGHTPNEYPGVENTPQESSNKPSRVGWKWALETCEQYFEFYKNDSWVPLDVEFVKGKILYEDDSIRILWKAKLDLLTETSNGIFPMDHKTAKQNRDKILLNNQFIGQCLVSETRSMIVNHIGLQTTLKPEEKFRREFMNYTSDKLMEWQSEILPYWAYKLVEYNENGYFPPNFTHCDSKYGICIFKDACEGDRNIREENLKIHFKVGAPWNPSNDSVE